MATVAAVGVDWKYEAKLGAGTVDAGTTATKEAKAFGGRRACNEPLLASERTDNNDDVKSETTGQQQRRWRRRR